MGNSVTKISFTAWFQKKLTSQSNKKLRPHHREAIWAFFQAKGLSDKEPASSYEECLALYGL